MRRESSSLASHKFSVASTGVSGVRSSCESMARNWSFALFAVSAASRASFSFCSCLLVLGEIAEDQHDAADLTAGIANRRAAVVDRHLRSISSNEKRVISETDDNAGAHDFLDRVFDRRARQLVDDLEDVR